MLTGLCFDKHNTRRLKPKPCAVGLGAIGACPGVRHNNGFYLPALSPLGLLVDVSWLNQQETGGAPDLGKRELHAFMCCSCSKDGVTLLASSS